MQGRRRLIVTVSVRQVDRKVTILVFFVIQNVVHPSRTGQKSGNIAETCRTHSISATLYYRWKDEVEKAAVAALGGRSAAAPPDQEQRKRIRELERSLGKAHVQIDILRNVLGE